MVRCVFITQKCCLKSKLLKQSMVLGMEQDGDEMAPENKYEFDVFLEFVQNQNGMKKPALFP